MAAENQEAEQSKSSNETDQTDGISFALIHEASSLDNFNQLEDPDSIESQIARGRGKVTAGDRVVDGDNGSGPAHYDVRIEEGRLKIESGYVIRFVDADHLHLSPFDVVELDAIRAYPAPEALIENLTPRIRGYLKEHGHVKVRGHYDSDDSKFYGLQMGWEPDEQPDPWDHLMEVIEHSSSTPAAVDYSYVEYGPERWGVEEVAEARGIEAESVRGNVRAVEREIDHL